jgi:osmotically-inducible protein OsmY
MSTSNFLRTVSCALLLGAPLIGCAVGNQDEKLTTNVQTAIDRHPDLGPPGAIQVQAHDGVVYLSGLADGDLAAEDVASVARRVKGVTDVVNSVSVDP